MSDLGEVLVVIRHTVADYATWRRGYDDFEPQRHRHGVTGAEVFVDPDDETRVTVLHRFASLTDAQDFLSMPELKEAMGAAGVTEAPDITIASRR
jgi:quinol monooxygenase YgiN